MARDLPTELRRAREALDRGFPEEAAERLAPWAGDPAADELRAEAQRGLRRPATAVPEPTPEQLAARRRAMIAVVVVTAVTAVTGLVAAVLIGLTT